MPNIYSQDFWQSEEIAMWDELDDVVLDALLAGVEGGTLLLPANAQVLVDFDTVNDAVIEYARKYRYEWIKGITDTTREQVQKLVSGWALSGEPLSVLETQLTPLFGDKRVEQISATESTRVYAIGNQTAFESTGIVDEVVWFTSVDDMVCPVCGELNGTHIGIGDIDALPPAHPSCRCRIQPVVSEEAFERKLEEILS